MESTPRKKSIFREVGLNDISTPVLSLRDPTRPRRPPPTVRFRSHDDVRIVERYDHGHPDHKQSSLRNGIPRRKFSLRTTFPLLSLSPGNSQPIMHRLGTMAILLVAVVSLLHGTSFMGHASLPLQPVSGNPMPLTQGGNSGSISLERRDTSPVDVCFRWSQQSAVVNGTLYLYGGQAKSESSQTENTWNNYFLSLDLTKSWQIASPALTGLSQPSGPPNVSNGILWNSHESLWLYGGEFSSSPWKSPTPVSTWEYDIASQSWNDHSDPQTSSGANAPSNGEPVQRAAEGAGISVPSLGRGFYFGGHQDPFTTPDWAQWIPRIYLQSLLEFTFPGYSNNQVDVLSNGKTTDSRGVYRNVTEGGLQSRAGFTQRADGLLIYVPGFGKEGILLSLAGGTNETFTQMNNMNVYDIANSTWYTQSTSGPTPSIRVNPCAVIAAAPDGSSYNIYMFGGQNLIPAGNQTQYSDMWILTLPSFTWIEVDQDSQSVPAGRSGHTCNIWDGQMVMVGGYVGTQLTCESPGIYVFDLSKLQWVNQFTALSSGSAQSGLSEGSSPNNSPSGTSSSGGEGSGFNSTAANNPLNQQPAQLYNATSPGGLEGSYGYQVPDAVISVIGGGPTGGATVTAPVQTATAGPLATGKPVTYTVTGPNGAATTQTSTPDSNSPGNTNSGGGAGTSQPAASHSRTYIVAIVVGVIAGLLFLLSCYLAFCSYVYRKQLQLYKHHVEMAQQQAHGDKISPFHGALAANSSATSTNGASTGAASSGNSSKATGGNQYQMVRRNSAGSVDEDCLVGNEPTFVGVMLNPRRSLRVINRD